MNAPVAPASLCALCLYKSQIPRAGVDHVLVAVFVIAQELKHPNDGLCELHKALLLDAVRFVHGASPTPAGDA